MVLYHAGGIIDIPLDLEDESVHFLLLISRIRGKFSCPSVDWGKASWQAEGFGHTLLRHMPSIHAVRVSTG